eukprot:111299-Alexandrium_andersonii.AAC.1
MCIRDSLRTVRARYGCGRKVRSATRPHPGAPGPRSPGQFRDHGRRLLAARRSRRPWAGPPRRRPAVPRVRSG